MSRLDIQFRMPINNGAASARILLALAMPTAIFLTGCAVPADPGAKTARETLTTLQADPVISANAPQALAEAARAVAAAELPQADKTEAAHSAYVAQVRLLTAKLHAEAQVDSATTLTLNARRDMIRHGNDSITTLATDAFDTTPQPQRLVPVTKDTPLTANLSPDPIPVAVASTKPAEPEPVAPQAEIADVPDSEPDAGPALLLPPSAFSATGLSPTGRAAIDQSLPLLAKFPNRMVVIVAKQPARLVAIRAYLLSKGFPSFRLAGNSDAAADSSVRVEFGGPSPA